MSRPKKKFAEILEDHLAVAPLQECREIFSHVRLLLHIRERQEAVKQEQESDAPPQKSDQ